MPEFLRELYAMARKSIRADGERRRRDAEDTTRRKEARAERLVAKALAMKRMAGGEVAMIRDHETGESTPAVSSAHMRGVWGRGIVQTGAGRQITGVGGTIATCNAQPTRQSARRIPAPRHRARRPPYAVRRQPCGARACKGSGSL